MHRFAAVAVEGLAPHNGPDDSNRSRRRMPCLPKN